MIKERHVQGWLEKGMAAFSSVYQVSQAMWAVVLVFRIGTKQVLKCCVCFFFLVLGLHLGECRDGF